MPLGEAGTPGYMSEGYARLEQLASPAVVQGLLGFIHGDMARADAATLARITIRPEITKKPTYELYSYQYAPIMGFHWGLTSRMCLATGKRLVPTYGFFRIYQSGDVCQIHRDRPSCEHSLSMPLAYSDGRVWGFDIGRQRYEDANAAPAVDDFGGEAFATLNLSPGDAVLYHGVNYRHGRLIPNPNRWSAHLFLHWVDAEGKYADWAFDRWPVPKAGDFTQFQAT